MSSSSSVLRRERMISDVPGRDTGHVGFTNWRGEYTIGGGNRQVPAPTIKEDPTAERAATVQARIDEQV